MENVVVLVCTMNIITVKCIDLLINQNLSGLKWMWRSAATYWTNTGKHSQIQFKFITGSNQGDNPD